MHRASEVFGNLAAVLGLLLCLASGLGRLAGLYDLAGFETITLFTAGMGLMLAGVLGKVHALGARRP